ncbi:MAG: hypothetical protein ACKOCV_04655 [Gemmatimonadota bacterium]
MVALGAGAGAANAQTGVDLTANRAYVLWLRSDRVEDTEGWRLSRRASATKAELMARFAEAGRPYGIAVPRASTLWP